MNKKLILDLRKAIFTVVAATCMVQVFHAAIPLQAAVQNEVTGQNTVSIKDTTITFKGLQDIEEGSLGLYIEATINRTSWFRNA